MPKSKEFIENSDSEEPKNSNKNDSASDEEPAKVSTSKKSKAKDKDDDPPAKRAKTNDETENDEVTSKTGSNGERLYEIGKLRYVSVSQFKGKPYINIREYYIDNNVEKPGKKGISLAADQWEKLKTLVNQIDKDLKKSK